jgi:NADPH:quinone reductase-like Zn-dependent oxidoreductase
MKAIVCTKYGPPEVLQFREVSKPVPKDNEVLIKVHAATVVKGDCELRGLEFSPSWQLIARLGFGFRGPRKKILGQELSGEIESVGKGVKLFQKGDQVFADTGLHMGAYAEYDCLPEKGLISLKPSNMTYEEAAAVPVGGLHSWYYLKKAHIQRGQKVLIIGAGGGIGTFAVQLAKAFGAEVTGIDSTNKLEVIRLLGADHVIDYGKEDFTKSGETFDVIFDIVGKSSFEGCVKSLKEKGYYLLGNPSLSHRLRAWASRSNGKKIIGGTISYKAEDLTFLKELIEAGKIRSAIDRRYPLEKMVDAHKYVDTGQKTGQVVINVSVDNGILLEKN